MKSQDIVDFVRQAYATEEFIPLHEPRFDDLERRYITETIDSTFVSSVGKFVDQMEADVARFCGATRAVATVNGTAALHVALYLSGVGRGDLVLTQALTFVATCNALYHLGAEPVFIDINRKSLGMCPVATRAWLEENANLDAAGKCVHVASGKQIKAVLPMHTFGHPVELDEFMTLCQEWNLPLIEDAAESLGSYYKGQHTGTIGQYGALSFNGNKIITTGGGGMLLCQNEDDGKHAKHVTTTAKRPHPYEFYHDEPGFNFRMPNLNAALGCAQMEKLSMFLEKKRELAGRYKQLFSGSECVFVEEPDYAQSNYWLNAIICPSKDVRDTILQETNAKGVMTRPVWQLMNRLPMFENALRGDLNESEWLEARLVNLPSSVIQTP